MAVAVPVLALAPAAQASSEDLPGETGRPDLVVSELPATPLRPGETSQASVTLTNRGTAAADQIVFRVRLTRGLDFPESVRGCTYTTTRDQVRQSLCHLDVTLDPGASTTVALPIKVLPKALMEAVEYGTDATGAEPGEGYSDSYRRTALDADSSADLVAVGDQVRGRAGRTVTVRAALRNDGPGWVQNNESDDQPALMVKIPEGTIAVRVPEECAPFEIDGPSGPSEPGKPQYVCYPPDHTLEVGSVHTYTFKLLIKRGTQSTSGEVRATSVYDIHPDFDHNAANDTATISVLVRDHHGHGPTPRSADLGSRSGAGPASGTAGLDAPGAHSATAARDTQASTDRASRVTLASDTADAAWEGAGRGVWPFVAAGTAAAAGLGGLAVLARRRRAHSS
jgi:hypothetical protein